MSLDKQILELKDRLVSLCDSSLLLLNPVLQTLEETELTGYSVHVRGWRGGAGGAGTSVRRRLLPLPLDVEGSADMRCGVTLGVREVQRTGQRRARVVGVVWVKKETFLDAR